MEVVILYVGLLLFVPIIYWLLDRITDVIVFCVEFFICGAQGLWNYWENKHKRRTK